MITEGSGNGRQDSTHRVSFRRFRLFLLMPCIVFVSVLGITACDGSAPHDGSTGTPRESTWAGTMHGKAERSSDLLSGGSSMRGDFLIRVDPHGDVNGTAVVAYDPIFDVEPLNVRLGLLRDNISGSLGALPGAFGLLGIPAEKLGALLHVQVEFPSHPVVERRITGHLRDGRLSLDWVDREPEVSARVVIRTEGAKRGGNDVTNAPLVAPDPLDATARVSAGWAFGRVQESTTSEGVKAEHSSYWNAHRVGGG